MHEADFFSLDVEGAESKVLQTVDPSAFKVVLVETQWPETDAFGRARNARVKHLLATAGLVRVPQLGNRVNHAWVRADVLGRCNHTVLATCRTIVEQYELPPMKCERHQNFGVCPSWDSCNA